MRNASNIIAPKVCELTVNPARLTVSVAVVPCARPMPYGNDTLFELVCIEDDRLVSSCAPPRGQFVQEVVSTHRSLEPVSMIISNV